ncbi:MAG TPA: hypothetical protein VFY73_29560 [Ideonella sp.]|uniref:hypothetical protein n=1 Tax=Ideonella sp. TaxID=1929293 RepID=UPI002E36D5BE|nr:hypothetical protein [Ideonella sp.]HEX5688186.1 hypothetical protein [Ideonella sp.]
MSTMPLRTTPGTLALDVAGADALALERGVSAAHEVLNAHGVSPCEADYGRWRRDLSEALGLANDPVVLTKRDALTALAWDEALRAAISAACAHGCADLHVDARLRIVESGAISPRPHAAPAVELD